MDNRQDDKKTNTPQTPQFLSREGENEILHNLDIKTQVDKIAVNNDDLLSKSNYTIDSSNIPTQTQQTHTINLADLNKSGFDVNPQNESDLRNVATAKVTNSNQNESIHPSLYLNNENNIQPSFNVSQTPVQSIHPPPYAQPIPPTPIQTQPIAPTQTKIIYKEKQKGCIGGLISFVFKSIGCLLFILCLLIVLFVYIINF